MNEEIKLILKMVEEGTVTAEEAEKLLSAIPSASAENGDVGITAKKPSPEPKKLSILVKEGNKVNVNMSIPFSLLRMGLKMGVAASAIGLNYARNDDEAELLELLKSIDVDEILSVVADNNVTLPYNIIDVADDKGRLVQIFLE